MKKILCVAVHPDDETLGAGGSLIRWKEEGNEIHWLVLTRIGEEIGFSQKRILKRKDEIDKVKRLYEFSSFKVLDFLTTKLDEYPVSMLVSQIQNYIEEIRPDTLLIPHRDDAHSDHRTAYNALKPFFKSFRYPYIKRVLAMEVISETGYSLLDSSESFVPNYFVNIDSFLDKKISIMRHYEGEILPHPFPRSEEGLSSLAKIRGAQSGYHYAEAFQVIKFVED